MFYYPPHLITNVTRQELHISLIDLSALFAHNYLLGLIRFAPIPSSPTIPQEIRASTVAHLSDERLSVDFVDPQMEF